jgi:hypothetical protein
MKIGAVFLGCLFGEEHSALISRKGARHAKNGGLGTVEFVGFGEREY